MNFCTKRLTTRCHSLFFSKLSSACYQVPGRSTRYQVPGSTRLVPATRYQLPGCATNRMICRVCKAWGAAFLRICNCPSSQDLDLNSFLSQGLDFNLYVSLPLDLRCVVMHIFQLESVDIVDSVAPSGVGKNIGELFLCWWWSTWIFHFLSFCSSTVFFSYASSSTLHPRQSVSEWAIVSVSY